MGEIVAKGGISPQQALRDAFERQNPRLARPASEHYAAGRRKGYKNGHVQALRDVLEAIRRGSYRRDDNNRLCDSWPLVCDADSLRTEVEEMLANG